MDYVCSINNTLGLKNLNAQQKWLFTFIKRYGMPIRRITHMGQKLPDNKTAIINPRITINDSVPNNSPKTVSKSTIITPMPIIKNFVKSENG